MADEATQPSGGESGTEKTDVNNGKKTFTQEQLGEKLSSERKKMREDFEKEKQEAIAASKAEWERQAKLTEEDRAKEAQEAQRKELEQRERDITLRERRSEAIEKLTEKGISTKLVDFVVDVNAEKTAKNIDILTKEFNDAVEKGIKEKLRGNTPTDRGSTTAGDGKKSASTGVYTGNGVRAF